jgi:hypothetical protein
VLGAGVDIVTSPLVGVVVGVASMGSGCVVAGAGAGTGADSAVFSAATGSVACGCSALLSEGIKMLVAKRGRSMPMGSCSTGLFQILCTHRLTNVLR